MKRMKTMAAALLILMLLGAGMNVWAAQPALTLTPDRETVQPGQTVEVSLFLEQEEAISGVQLRVHYDVKILEYRGGSWAEEWLSACDTCAMNGQQEGSVQLIAASGRSIKARGEILTLSFAVAEDAAGATLLEIRDLQVLGGESGIENIPMTAEKLELKIESPAPTAEPTAAPTATPTASPTQKPTAAPTATPAPDKDDEDDEDDEEETPATPTPAPTPAAVLPAAPATATPAPAAGGTTVRPTAAPTAAPTPENTSAPTPAPTAAPEPEETAAPTAAPTEDPDSSAERLSGFPWWILIGILGVLLAILLILGIATRRRDPRD